MANPHLPTRRCRGRRDSAGIVALLLLALVLGGCGLPESRTVGVTLVEPTRTATPLPPTATPTAVPTAVPTIPPTPRVSPTPVSAGPSAAPTPVGGYGANWRDWEVDTTPQPDYRRTYDPAMNEYHIALLTDDQQWSFYAPEGTAFQNFTLELEAYPVAGPDTLGYGVVFRRQPRVGDKASERYIFYLTPQGRFSFYQVTPDNTEKTLRQFDAPDQQGVIMVGQAPNRLKVTCQGATIILAINGVEVFRMTNATITQPGEIGVFASTPVGVRQTEVAFKELVLTPLP